MTLALWGHKNIPKLQSRINFIRLKTAKVSLKDLYLCIEEILAILQDSFKGTLNVGFGLLLVN